MVGISNKKKQCKTAKNLMDFNIILRFWAHLDSCSLFWTHFRGAAYDSGTCGVGQRELLVLSKHLQ